MKPDKISDAIGLVDKSLVEEADLARHTVRRDRRWWAQWTAIAACLCLMVACVFSLPRVSPPFSSGESVSSQLQTDTTNKRPAVSKAMAVSQAVYPDRNKVSSFESWRALREGGYDDSFSSFYDKTMKQFLVGKAGENRVFSPANVFVSLAMLAEAVDGNGRRQILELLGADNIDSLRTQTRLFWETNYEKAEYNTTLLANSIWMDQDLWYKEDLLNTLSKHYYASSFSGKMGDESYDQMLQNWINEQTGGILQEQVEGVQMDPSAVLNLVSTIYFGARWGGEFRPELTEEGVFHTAKGDVPCEYMRYDELRYLRQVYIGDGFKSLALTLGDKAMYFVLPDKGVSVNEVIRNNNLFEVIRFSQDDVNGDWDVKLSVPKFDISADVDLQSGLKKLGVTDIFNSRKADFSPLLVKSKGVSVSEIQHAARVSIDEEGCTAAAFTNIGAAGGYPISNGPLEFILDRPFVFLIADGQESVLFAGVVEQP